MKYFILIHFVFSCSASKAAIHLPAFFSDNMVLQQKMNDAIWGTASPNVSVQIKASWSGKIFSGVADSKGNWKIFVSAPAAGGPFTIKITDPGSDIILKNVLIGEVWFCSGQSNMEMPVRGYPGQPVNGSLDAIIHGDNPQIHLLRVEKNLSVVPLSDVKGSWTESNAESVSEMSAVAFSFGKYLQEVLGVPIGIIHSSWGGTRIECWMSADTLKHFPFVDLSKVPEKNASVTPTILYNAMVAPFLGYGMKGCIWYQGESNRFEFKEYERLMPALINNWRSNWAIGDFPFYFVQIAPFSYWNEKNNSAFIREAQLKSSIKTKNSGLAITMDIGGEMEIHPREKFTVGKRLAYWALAKDYGMKNISCSGPVFTEMKKSGDSIRIVFNDESYGIAPDKLTPDSLVGGFEIAGTDREFHPAHAKMTGTSEITVWSDQLKAPAAVRYGWKNWFVGTLFSSAGLPASSFRTDDWEQ